MFILNRLAAAGFIAPPQCERDPGFKAEIVRFNRIGMRLAAGLAVFGSLLGVLADYLFVGTDVLISNVWLELLIIFLGFIIFGASFSRTVQRWGRLFIAFVTLIMYFGMMTETIQMGMGADVAGHGTPVTMMMLIVIGTMPYRGWHTLLLGILFGGAYVSSILFVPGTLDLEPLSLAPDSFIFLTLITSFCIAISTLIYNSRWRQYQARRDEEDLRKQVAISERKYRSLYEDSADGIFVVNNQTGKILLTNPALQKMLGMTGDELERTSFQDLTLPNSLDQMSRHREEREYQEGMAGPYTIKLKSKSSGEPLICDLTIHHTENQALFMGAVRDIGQQVEMQSQLRQLAQFPATNPFPVLRCDYDGTILYANDSAWGLPGKIGHPDKAIEELLPPDFVQKIQHLIDNDQTIIDEHHQIFNKIFSITFRPIPDLKQVFVWMLDITERIRSEEKVRAYTAELEAKNRQIRETQAQLVQSEKMASLGNLVAGVAHEINTPLGSIHANADLSRRALEIVCTLCRERLEQDDVHEPAKVQQALQILEESNATTLTASERIVNIVKSLRNFARLDEAKRKKVDLHEGLESTLTLIHHELKNRIEVVRNFGKLPFVVCFPNQINQVFMNLLVNGMQAIEGPGTITITTRTAQKSVIVEIHDTGAGISPENLQKIFDPGFTTKGVGVGTGLGLSIVYKIIEAHGGKITVDSTVGKGTTFTITLPILAES